MKKEAMENIDVYMTKLEMVIQKAEREREGVDKAIKYFSELAEQVNNMLKQDKTDEHIELWSHLRENIQVLTKYTKDDKMDITYLKDLQSRFGDLWYKIDDLTTDFNRSEERNEYRKLDDEARNFFRTRLIYIEAMVEYYENVSEDCASESEAIEQTNIEIEKKLDEKYEQLKEFLKKGESEGLSQEDWQAIDKLNAEIKEKEKDRDTNNALMGQVDEQGEDADNFGYEYFGEKRDIEDLIYDAGDIYTGI